jgi:glycosyltransferase involved in cell wall biosynthesis
VSASRPRAAVIVTTYNRPDALRSVLDGYLAQEGAAFELLVADDGSSEETRELVGSYAARSPFPLRHVWQEDRGFRAAAIRNRALAQTDADYVIFSDGDCVPPTFFVQRHLALAEANCFVAGNRVLLSESFTHRILSERIAIHRWDALRWLLAWAKRDVNRLTPLVRLPASLLRKFKPRRWRGVKTCNLAVWRADLVRVNGFDERYAGWGLEDSDLVIRLLNSGVQHKSGRFHAPVLHLWHRENDRSALAENEARLKELLGSGRVVALEGLDRHT